MKSPALPIRSLLLIMQYLNDNCCFTALLPLKKPAFYRRLTNLGQLKDGIHPNKDEKILPGYFQVIKLDEVLKISRWDMIYIKTNKYSNTHTCIIHP